MKYFNIITEKRQSFISDDVIDEILNGKHQKRNDKDFVALLTKMRLDSYDLGIQELLRTLHYYNFANTQKSGLVINISLLANSLNKPNTIEILKQDFFVSTITQLYITLDALVSATPINAINTKDFFDERQKIKTARQKLQNDYVSILKNSLSLKSKDLNKILFGDIYYAGKQYTLVKFPYEFPKDNPNFLNNDIESNLKVLSSINNYMQRSVQK